MVIKGTILGAALLLATTGAHAQWGGILDKANSVLNNGKTGNTNIPGGNYTNNEAVAALKDALKIGAQNATGKLSSVNGFFGNQLIKIIMPPEAQKVEATLRAAGMGSYVDKAVLAMNRAAEDASGKAVNIFINTITTMSVQDGISVVKGGQGAATNYLKSKTTPQLTEAFRPIIQGSLNKTNATKYWTDVFTLYNKLPLTQKVNTDLTAYVTERALSGLFVTISDEENKIRNNASSQVTDLLRKVFGRK
ncbi:MAG: DUF4197 domain-containing protein [Sphingobacteriales bacterium]|nr:MAG: DUF4197 domain-containing protein [Sphingobacteriales bacterium]